MRILFVGGGTAGHINPALSVAQYIRKMHPDAQILYVGTPYGMESKLVPEAGFNFKGIEVLGFQRQFNWRNIKNNIKAVRYLVTSGKKAEKILKEFNPDLVMGTGGYVSGPVVLRAAKMGIKTVTHEQNAFPGVTTKLLSKRVDKILLAFSKANDFLHMEQKTVVTGNPVREDFIFGNKLQARKELGLDERPVILSFGGSLGARKINETVAELIAWDWKDAKIQHIHATGRYGTELFPELLTQYGVDYKNAPHIRFQEYIFNLATCMAAADLVISRAGAITLCEIEAAAKPSILIPSPNVSENHQYHNAMVLANQGAAVVIEEKDLTGKRLRQEVEKLIFNQQRLKEFSKKAGELAILDSTKKIYQELMKLIKRT